MRINEDKIWNAYVSSLIEEKKKKGLPPWLQKDGKKDEEKDDVEEKDEKDEKDEKKSSKKKGKKGLPPWLKGKGKKMVKENMNDEGLDGASEEGQTNEVDSMRLAISEMLNDMDENQVREIYDMVMGKDDNETAAPSASIDHVENMKNSEPEANHSADTSTARYMR